LSGRSLDVPRCNEHTAGKVRGHASLMQPAKPSPGVPFVGVTAIPWSERTPRYYRGLSAEVESLNLPLRGLTNVIANRGDVAMLLPSIRAVKPDHPGTANVRYRPAC
jgi:hypothetical protein